MFAVELLFDRESDLLGFLELFCVIGDLLVVVGQRFSVVVFGDFDPFAAFESHVVHAVGEGLLVHDVLGHVGFPVFGFVEGKLFLKQFLLFVSVVVAETLSLGDRQEHFEVFPVECAVRTGRPVSLVRSQDFLHGFSWVFIFLFLFFLGASEEACHVVQHFSD